MCRRQGWNVGGGNYTTRFKNANGTVFRELLYHWHPWFGMSVAIHEAIDKADGVVFRCTLSGSAADRWLEVPAWMFERAMCPDPPRVIGPQRLALPLGGLAIGTVEPGARNRDLDRPEGAGQRSCSVTMAVARYACSPFAAGHLATSITRTRQNSIELAADQFFNELPSPVAHRGLDRIEPIVEKSGRSIARGLRRIRLRDSVRHGVVSSPALQRRMIRGWSPRRLRHTQFLPTSRRHRWDLTPIHTRTATSASAQSFDGNVVICAFDFQSCVPLTDAAVQARGLSAEEKSMIEKLRQLTSAPSKVLLGDIAASFGPLRRLGLPDFWFPEVRNDGAERMDCGLHLIVLDNWLVQINWGVQGRFRLIFIPRRPIIADDLTK